MSLSSEVLILDKAYRPIDIFEGKRALGLLFLDKALALDELGNTYDSDSWVEYSEQLIAEDPELPYISSVYLRVFVPKAIILQDYLYRPSKRKKLSYRKSSVLKRDDHQCQYCGCRPPKNSLTIDHILPKSRGGKNSWLNTVAACKSCNTQKGNKTPSEANMKLKRPPFKPSWNSLAIDRIKLPEKMMRSLGIFQ